MVVKQHNIQLVTFEPRDVDGHKLSAEMMKALMQKRTSIPVVFRVGKVDYNIGYINTVRVGREVAFGDVALELAGELEFKAVTDSEGKLMRFETSKYVYRKK